MGLAASSGGSLSFLPIVYWGHTQRIPEVTWRGLEGGREERRERRILFRVGEGKPEVKTGCFPCLYFVFKKNGIL